MFGKNLSSLRKSKGLTQYELAERLGFSRGQLANYEQGQREPDFESLQKIANFFDVSTDYLIGRTDNKNSETTNKKTSRELTPYQQTVLDWVTSKEDFSFYESPEELIDMIEQFELMYERMRKKE